MFIIYIYIYFLSLYSNYTRKITIFESKSLGFNIDETFTVIYYIIFVNHLEEKLYIQSIVFFSFQSRHHPRTALLPTD